MWFGSDIIVILLLMLSS